MSRYGVIGAVAGLAGAVIALRMGWPGVVDFAVGAILGAFTMSGLRSLVSGLGPGSGGARHTLSMVLHLLKYPLILAVLYLLLVSLHRNALLVMGGYTLSLVAFLLQVLSAPTRAAPAAPKA